MALRCLVVGIVKEVEGRTRCLKGCCSRATVCPPPNDDVVASPIGLRFMTSGDTIGRPPVLGRDVIDDVSGDTMGDVRGGKFEIFLAGRGDEELIPLTNGEDSVVRFEQLGDLISIGVPDWDISSSFTPECF